MNNKARISEVLRRNAGATGLVARSDKTIFLPPITALIPHSLHPYTLIIYAHAIHTEKPPAYARQ